MLRSATTAMQYNSGDLAFYSSKIYKDIRALEQEAYDAIDKAVVDARHAIIQKQSEKQEITIKKGVVYSVDDMKLVFDQYNTDPENAILAEKVFEAAKKLNVRYKFDSKVGSGTAGIATADKVRFNYEIYKARMGNPSKAYNYYKTDPNRFAETLLHETIHTVTMYYLNGNLMEKDGKYYVRNFDYYNILEYDRKDYNNTMLGTHEITKDTYDAIMTINEVYKEVSKREYADIFKTSTGYKMYGLTDPMELIAELSDPEFRTALKKVNLFDKLVDAIRKLLGIKPKTSAYDASKDALYKFIDNLDHDINYIDDNNTLWKKYSSGVWKFSIRETKNMNYLEQVDGIINGTLNGSNSLYIDVPSQDLQNAGFTAYPFAMNQSDLRKSMRTKTNNNNRSAHSISENVIKKLPQLLNEAVMFVDNIDKVTIITNEMMRDKEGNNSFIIAGIWKNQKINNDNVNLVKSIYPYDNVINRIEKAAINGKLVITNKNKANDMLIRIGIQSSERSKIIDLAKSNISPLSENVNSFDESSIRSDANPAERVFYSSQIQKQENTIEKGVVYNVWDIEKMFYKYNTDSENDLLAQKVFAAAKKLNVRYKFDTRVPYNEFGLAKDDRVRMNYNHSSYQISPDALEGNQDVFARTLLHETIHTITSYYLYGNAFEYDGDYYITDLRQKETYKISKETYDAIQTIKEIYKEISKEEYSKIFETIFGDKMYGLKNEKELVSELANSSFRTALKKVNIFDKLVDAIRKLLGIKPKTSAYDATKDALYKLIDNLDYDKPFINTFYSNELLNENDENWKFSIRETVDNNPVVVVNDSLSKNAINEKDLINTAKQYLSRFKKIPINKQNIKILSKTEKEYTNSKYSYWLSKNSKQIFNDKMDLAAHPYDIIYATTNYINEEPEHIRKDNIVNFARGNLLLDIQGRKYQAESIFGITKSGVCELYDVINLNPTNFEYKKTDVSHRVELNDKFTEKETPSVYDGNITQLSANVNSFEEKDIFSLRGDAVINRSDAEMIAQLYKANGDLAEAYTLAEKQHQKDIKKIASLKEYVSIQSKTSQYTTRI